jgi:hypothetical protein
MVSKQSGDLPTPAMLSIALMLNITSIPTLWEYFSISIYFSLTYFWLPQLPWPPFQQLSVNIIQSLAQQETYESLFSQIIC